MEDRLDGLLKKYWEGASTLAEEQEMKGLLAQLPGYAREREFFEGLESIKGMKPKQESNSLLLKVSKDRGWERNWMKIAATVFLLVCAGLVVYQFQVQKKEAQAYAQVMEAFNLIQQNLQKGEKEMEIMDDLKYLNAPHQLFNLNELKNE